MGALSILQTLVEAGMTVEAACAMAGNMMAESGLKANIAQRGMTKLTDEQYTERADNCCIPPDAGLPTVNFNDDGVGYGLCQWTHPTRKQHLLDYAQSMGASVGDEFTQVQFCLAELKTDFPALWKFLCETHDGYVATERICKEYERPAMNNIETRYKYALDLYAKYSAALSAEASHADDIDREPSSYILPDISEGRTPEAEYLAALLKNIGYDVLWSGLWACIVDFQGKTGLTVDGICGEKTWARIMQEGKK